MLAGLVCRQRVLDAVTHGSAADGRSDTPTSRRTGPSPPTVREQVDQRVPSLWFRCDRMQRSATPVTRDPGDRPGSTRSLAALPEVRVVDQLWPAHDPVVPFVDDGAGTERPVAALRPTATARDPRTGSPLDRCAHTAEMLARLARESLDAAAPPGGAPSRSVSLSAMETEVVAELLDELAGVYPHEELGQLAGSLSARLWERLSG